MKSKKRPRSIKSDAETDLSQEFGEGGELGESTLQRMKKAIEAQQSQDASTGENIIEVLDTDPEELERQIQEDLALQLLQDHQDQQDQKEDSDAGVDLDSVAEGTVSSINIQELDEQETQSCIEALIFLAEKPLSLKKLKAMLGPEAPNELFEQALAQMKQRYEANCHGIELVEVAGGFQFRTKPIRAGLGQRLAKVQTQRLSRGAMETLAIIAYRQPLLKEQIDLIRGVDSSYFLRTLLEKKLIEISGRSELPGRPLLYITTQDFLEIFALKDLQSLPPLQEIEQMVPHLSNESEDPQVQQIRQMVHQMNASKEKIQYDPREDDRLLREIRDRVKQIPSSTPYLEEQKKQEEALAQQLELENASSLPEADKPMDPESNSRPTEGSYKRGHNS